MDRGQAGRDALDRVGCAARIERMTADLGKYTDLHIFKEAFPDRYYQMGMAEQLLMGAAAGLAHEGFMPFATTYAVFAARRAYDFIHQTIAEEGLDVKIVAALPGLTSGYGPSHQAAEDLALFRAMPGMTVVDPCDALEIEQAVPAIADHRGPVYMRLLRGQVPLVLDRYGYRFVLGRAQLLRDTMDHIHRVDAEILATDVGTFADLELRLGKYVQVRGGARADVLHYDIDDRLGNFIAPYQVASHLVGYRRTATGVAAGPRASVEVTPLPHADDQRDHDDRAAAMLSS